MKVGGGGSSGDVHGPEIRTFYPEAWAGEPVDGAFLVDSLYYLKGKKGKKDKDEYLPRTLQRIWEETGWAFMAVCSGGAALVKPKSRWEASFAELLAEVPRGVKALTAVICGNDLLTGSAYRPAWDEAAVRLCAGMQDKAALTFVVIGGSAALWKYASTMTASQMQAYDANAARLRETFVANGVRACSGVRELEGVEIAGVPGFRDRSWGPRDLRRMGRLVALRDTQEQLPGGMSDRGATD